MSVEQLTPLSPELRVLLLVLAGPSSLARACGACQLGSWKLVKAQQQVQRGKHWRKLMLLSRYWGLMRTGTYPLSARWEESITWTGTMCN